ncbi:hypothetical protein NAL32_19915 [Chryseobacterium sp. Ch-15]|uniref:Uncharacterized protein n=1 Tax=Chryseobacterium muglaense TaxID=2893752 RepID=A0A9Q3URC4_9FLAO|nr:hypothetical protein [Chryseobacterium muglaense]MBD3906931.1 hypothetical protein [Chryseobacterium muglaense]MCC9033739.1 hypothetical protein [Chryseobacterium muglaense]MCM2556663.1 hypothetical protein [Chryseobacterium muglaense]
MKDEYFDYTCNVNGQEFKHRLKIAHRFTEHKTICPICGAENCGGPEDKFIWAEFDDEKLAIHFGDGEFERYLEFWYYDGITEKEYKLLPNFIQDFNESTGWNNEELNPNSVIDASDFKNAMNIIKQSKHINDGDDFSKNFYPKIIKFVDQVIKENKTLNILKY